MSRIAPDIPELQHVPDAARSLVYVRAFHGAIRSPLTWLIGAIVIAVGVGIGATQGNALFGRIGAVLGTAAGASASIWCFFILILPWRTRHLLRSTINPIVGSTVDQVRQADENLARMIDEYKRRQ